MNSKFENIIDFHYKAVQYVMISHAALLWQQQNLNQTLNSQTTPHTTTLTGEL